MSDTFLERTSSNSSNSQRIGTISVWLKRGKLSTTQYILANYIDGNNYGYFRFDSSNRLHYVNSVSGSHSTDVVTSRKLTDTSAWFHLCVAVDSTQGTASNRVKIYVNGTQETAFDTGTYGGQDDSHRMWMASASGGHRMGSQQTTTSHFDGCMSHFHFIDGTAYAASDFGETDSTTGEWKIKTSPSVTYGSEGYFMLKDDNSLTDDSGNGNNFIVGNGTFTKTEDNPSNVFNTFNPNIPLHGNLTLSHGNTTLSSTNGQWLGTLTTIPLFGGKWYYECKYNTGHGIKLSIQGYKADLRHWATANNSYGEYNDNGYGYQFNNSGNDYLGNNASSPNWGGGLSSNTGDKIYMVALNLENGKIWYGADGTWFNDANGDTGNPTTDAYPHQTISATHLAQTPLLVCGSVEGNGATMNWNFGNGYFGTTAVSSAGNNASGLGIFEYDVPTGFTAICTKGLNE